MFVYGSLRRGYSNEREMAGAQLELPETSLFGYRRVLYDSGYPAIHPHPGSRVRGEAYLVDEAHLARLDAFEGCPEWYERALVRLETGETAFAYVIPEERGRDLPSLAHEDSEP